MVRTGCPAAGVRRFGLPFAIVVAASPTIINRVAWIDNLAQLANTDLKPFISHLKRNRRDMYGHHNPDWKPNEVAAIVLISRWINHRHRMHGLRPRLVSPLIVATHSARRNSAPISATSPSLPSRSKQTQ